MLNHRHLPSLSRLSVTYTLLLVLLPSCSLRQTQMAAGVCTTVDAARSWGQPERVPWMRQADGTFGARGATVKAGVFTALVISQQPVKEKHWVKWANAGIAGAYCAAGGIR
jgi:hypothetical protein